MISDTGIRLNHIGTNKDSYLHGFKGNHIAPYVTNAIFKHFRQQIHDSNQQMMNVIIIQMNTIFNQTIENATASY